jgi:hypothetical protein
LVYNDPTMLTQGWNPDVGESWPVAPEGTYWLYVQPNVTYSSGDVFTLTVGGQTRSTRTEWAGAAGGRWFPLGPYHLGQNRSRRLGNIPGDSTSTFLGDEMFLTRNGVSMNPTASPVRLIREAEDSSLLHVRNLVDVSSTRMGAYLFIDPPTFDQPRPGIFAGSDSTGVDATSRLEDTDSWAWPLLAPPVTALWVQASNTTTPAVTVVHRPAFHTFNTDAA